MSFNSTVFSQIMQQTNKYNFKNQVSMINGDKFAYKIANKYGIN
jgi:hypothetical protein